MLSESRDMRVSSCSEMAKFHFLLLTRIEVSDRERAHRPVVAWPTTARGNMVSPPSSRMELWPFQEGAVGKSDFTALTPDICPALPLPEWGR